MLLARALVATLTIISLAANAQIPALPGVQVDKTLVVNSAVPMYRQTGEQYRIYEFPGTGEPIPYRLFVPRNWTPAQHLPMLVTLRAGTSINSNHRETNDLVVQAGQHGYIVVSPLGYRGYAQPYYGSPYPVDRPAGPSVPAAGWTAEENQRAEQDVLNVLALVAAEYNADTKRLFLHGQNPSGSAAFNFAAKYPDVFKAIVVSSGPIITASYPFANLAGKVNVLILHGDKDSQNTVAASERMFQELQQHGIKTEFHLVPGGEHLNAYLKDAAGIFNFLDKQ
ncbi:MAG: prolyl oligopeptidase family serine peptidase [Gammaproteobacteria bacterium]